MTSKLARFTAQVQTIQSQPSDRTWLGTAMNSHIRTRVSVRAPTYPPTHLQPKVKSEVGTRADDAHDVIAGQMLEQVLT